MFKSLDEMIEPKQSRFGAGWEALIRWVTGIAIASAGFQAVYSFIFAFE
jgi:hypothetical protein